MSPIDHDRISFFRASWNRAWTGIGAGTSGDSEFDALIKRHSESWRAYHTVHHLAECLDSLDSVRAMADRPLELELALWFHDAVYDPRKIDNEETSASVARQSMVDAEISEAAIELVESLILATKHTTLPSSNDERLIVDIDLAILGSSPTRFAEYEEQIRSEYSFVPIDVFRQKRGEILQSFLDRQRIYSTDHFHDLLEANARKNLSAVLTSTYRS